LPSKATPRGLYRLLESSYSNTNFINTNNTDSERKKTQIQLKLESEPEKETVRTAD